MANTIPTIYPVVGGSGGSSPQTNQNSTILGLPSNREFFLWGISAIALIALADPAPNLAIFICWLLIVGVLLMNSTDYINLLNSAFGGK